MLLVREPDQETLRETTARYLGGQADPATLRSLRDHPNGFDAGYWRDGVQLGWTHLLVDESHGGGSVSGHGLVDLGLLAHEFGSHAAPGPLAAAAVVAGALSEAAGPIDVIEGLLAGELLATWAGPLDPGLGTAASEVSARIERGDVVLTGEARPVESVAASAFVLVTAVGPEGLLQVLVPTDAKGCSETPLHSVDLTRRFSTLRLEEVRLPHDAVVEHPAGAEAALRSQLLQLTVLGAAESVGAMQSAFDMTLEWTKDRYTFGRQLASYQAIKHRMAHLAMGLQASHAISDEATEAVAVGEPDAAKLASAAAAYVGEVGSELLQDCVQLHGGIGVTFEHDLHLFLRRHTLNRTLRGSPAEHRRRVTRELRAELSHS